MNNEFMDYTKNIPDRFNPFNNDTENINYRDDYRKIVPQISANGCIIPEKPSNFEKRNIRKIYSKTSFVLISHLVLSNIVAIILTLIVSMISQNYVNASNIEDFFNQSSIQMDIVAITYTIVNISAFLIGCNILQIPIKNVFNKPQINTSNMIRHICIAWCFQGACMIVISLIYSIFLSFDIDLIPESLSEEVDYSNITYCISTFLYSCIIAPITEEMLFRGVILKGFSIVSQRFGIIMSALLFGLLHGNILQFITTFTVGIYLGFVATKYNSIIPTIVMHFFINLIPTIFEISLSNNELVYNIVMYGFYFIMIILGIVFICLGITKKSNRLPIQNASQKKRTLPIALSSVGVLSILAMYIFSMILTHTMD